MSLQLPKDPYCGSATSEPWQKGKPKCSPLKETLLSSQGGKSSPNISLPLSVNQSSFV